MPGHPGGEQCGARQDRRGLHHEFDIVGDHARTKEEVEQVRGQVKQPQQERNRHLGAAE